MLEWVASARRTFAPVDDRGGANTRTAVRAPDTSEPSAGVPGRGVPTSADTTYRGT